MNLKNKVILVTGSAKRVGKTIALTLAQRGAQLAVHYRSSKAQAQRTAAQLQSLGARAKIFQADLSDVNSLRAMTQAVIKEFKRIDVLVNSASIYEPSTWQSASEKDWDMHMDTNAKGAFFLSQLCAQDMMRRNQGRIINLIDSNTQRPYAGYLPYLVSKFAIEGLTLCLAKELAPHIQVNGISPGPVLLAPGTPKDKIKRVIAATPLHRIGSAQDVANAVLFLLEQGDFMTGTIIPVDGGQHIR